MSSRASRVLVWMVVAVCLGLAAAAPASAQIYAIRDENGVLTLSDKPLGAGAQTYAVRGATSTVRATRGSGEGVRSSQWDDVIDYRAREHGIRPDLVRAVIQAKSAFNPRARSNKGAMGLMQLMPATARELGVRNAYDPLENIRGGVAYLRHLLDRYENNEELALAAYNAGPGAVDKYGQSVPPYKETRNYVKQISRMTDVSDTSTRPIVTRDNSIFRVTEVIDGRTIVRYTDKKPTTGTVEVVGSR
jgi:soluble lytic murein transglycosylase-like protein